jgi:hypothetical protein
MMINSVSSNDLSSMRLLPPVAGSNSPQPCLSVQLPHANSRCASVVNMARILVAQGIRDRAIERTVREAAAAAAAITAATAAPAAATTTAVTASDAGTERKHQVAIQKIHRPRHRLPPIDSTLLACTKSDIVVPSNHMSAIPVQRTKFPPRLGNTLFKRSNRNSSDSNYAHESGNVSQLQATSIRVFVHSQSCQQPPTTQKTPPPSLPQPAFKQSFSFADNDLSAPFRQDASIKKPTLNLLVTSDAACESFNHRRSVLLQRSLDSSGLRGPGHSSVSSGSKVLLAALSEVSKQISPSARQGISVKRNFALA